MGTDKIWKIFNFSVVHFYMFLIYTTQDVIFSSELTQWLNIRIGATWIWVYKLPSYIYDTTYN